MSAGNPPPISSIVTPSTEPNTSMTSSANETSRPQKCTSKLPPSTARPCSSQTSTSMSHSNKPSTSQPCSNKPSTSQPYSNNSSTSQPCSNKPSISQPSECTSSTKKLITQQTDSESPRPSQSSILAQLLLCEKSSVQAKGINPVVVSGSPSKPDPTLWIPHLDLYQRDKEILQSNRWLNDNIIYAAQMLLKNQSGNKIQGWMDTQCSKRKELFPAVPPYTQFIQILNTCNSHWFTVARNSQYNDIVLIYDSAFASRVRMSLDIQMAICSIVRPQPDIINFDVVDVQNQPNGSDCGLFAIAFATELVHGHDPAGSFFDTLSL